MQSCLVVEDIEAVAEQLAEHVQVLFPSIQVRIAGSLQAARQQLAEGSPDLLLLDLGLPDGEGGQLLDDPRLRPETWVIVTTIFDDDEHLFGTLQAGARGYLLKDEPPERFRQALLGILDGQPPLSPSIAQRILRSFQPASHAEPLTPREREVLALIARGFSVAATAEQLILKPNTVAGYLKAIYQKLQVHNRAGAALKARGMGLVRD